MMRYLAGALLAWSWLTGCSSSSGGCKSNADCRGLGDNYICLPGKGECICTPVCADTCCGDDRCGSVCPDTCGQSGATCNPATCQCEGCTSGDRRCVETVVQRCDAGSWTVVEDCASRSMGCTDGFCQGESCTAGATRCSSSNPDTVETCVAGAWHTGTDCAAQSMVCANGVCQDVTCTDGQLRCNGFVLEICQQSHWASQQDCAATSQACIDNRCQAPACTNGQQRCQGNWIEMCVSGAWAQVTDCADNGQVCNEGRCVTAGPTHTGAASYCHCDQSTCSTPCPQGAEAASTCLYNASSGDGYCTFNCTANLECLADFAAGCCKTFPWGSVCVKAAECPGTSQAGQPCPLNLNGDAYIVHGDKSNCADGLACVGWDADPASSPSCTAYEQCLVYASVYNPICVTNGTCGASMCVAPCSGGTCPAGFEPVNTSGGDCVCAPSRYGDAGPGQPCESPLTPTAHLCQQGLTCLWGNETSFCSFECTDVSQCAAFSGGCCIATQGGKMFCHPQSFCG